MDIFDAIIKHDIGEVSRILKKDNSQNQLESDDITPLHFAVSYRVPNAVFLLLNSGADINCTNADGLTPLDYAIELKYTEIIDIFNKYLSGYQLCF